MSTNIEHQLTTAFFAGSFNPFTIGHADIVERALKVLDSVIIGLGFNIRKPSSQHDVEERAETIRKFYGNNSRVRVEIYSGLTAEAAKEYGAKVLLRGVRDIRDFEYEKQMADVNMRMFGIETLLLISTPELASVSSSMVRELESCGVDVSELIPHNENKL